MTVFYPWCRESGLSCVGWSPNARRSDVVTLILECGLAESLIDAVCSTAC